MRCDTRERAFYKQPLRWIHHPSIDNLASQEQLVPDRLQASFGRRQSMAFWDLLQG